MGTSDAITLILVGLVVFELGVMVVASKIMKGCSDECDRTD